jgi:hypothetical protein
VPLRSRKIQSDVPTASLLVSKAHGLNLMVFAKHRLKAKSSVVSVNSVAKKIRVIREIRV